MPCLPENVVVELVLGRASADVRADAERHLDGCPTCRRLVAEMAKASLLGPSPSPPASDEPDTSGPMGSLPLMPRGTAVGRYVIVGLTGSGGVGVVFAAFDPELDRKVALKLLRSESRADPSGSDRRARLLREAQAMARLSHPNVISVFDVGSYEGRVFIAMEFVDGSTLSQWLRDAKRSWRDVLQMFIRAGRGLAAAHAAGIIHRDFKPDNVLVGKDGQVRVTDFGLARVAGDSERPAVVPTSSPSEVTFTASGTMMGTPAYMSPEQYAGKAADIRTDQFSFCVALYEGLYGERPFEGKSMDEVRTRVTRGEIRAPPTDSPVPGWLRRVVVRGLSPSPQERHASMDELLSALARNRSARWRRAALAAGGLALACAGAVGGRAAFSASSVCGGGEPRLTRIWDGARKSEVREAFFHAGGDYGRAAWPKVERALDAYAQSWLEARRDACLATRVRGEQSERLLDLRMDCLDRELGQLDQLARVFTLADAEVVAQSVSAASELRPLSACESSSTLSEQAAPPQDPVKRASIVQAQTFIAQARALEAAARLRPALEAAKSAAQAADQSAFPPVKAEAAAELGTLHEKSGDFAAAARDFDEAIWAAEGGRHDEARARGWAGLQRARRMQGRLADADEAARHAEAVLTRLGGRDDLDADRLDERGLLRIDQGRLDDALTDISRAKVVRERVLGPLHPLQAESLSHLGRVLSLKGQDKEALVAFEAALARRRELFPPEHPEVARALLDVAETLGRLGRSDESLSQAQRAASMLEKALGADHPSVADAAFILGDALRRAGHSEQADAAYHRAVGSWTVWMGERHPRLVTGFARLGEVAAASGRLDEAERDFRRALEIADQALPAEHPLRVEPLVDLGMLLARKDKVEATPLLERAVALGESRPELSAEVARARAALTP